MGDGRCMTRDQAVFLGIWGVQCDHAFYPFPPLHPGSSYGLQVPWMDSTRRGEAAAVKALLERPCEWVDGLLPLRTSLAPRTPLPLHALQNPVWDPHLRACPCLKNKVYSEGNKG